MFGLKDDQVHLVLEKMGYTVECLSPLEVRKEESFARNYFAEIVMKEALLEACNLVLDYRLGEWHTNNEDKTCSDSVGLTETEYSRWVENARNISIKRIQDLINAFLENPAQYIRI